MPRDSNGNTQPLGGTIVSTGDPILPSQHNPALVDLYEMMSQSLSRDGQGGMRANLNMNGYRIVNVATSSASGDLATNGSVDAKVNAALGNKVTGDFVSVVGLDGDNPSSPYVRRKSNNQVVYLQPKLSFTPVQQYKSGTIRIGWNGSRLCAQVDATDFNGNWPIDISGHASSAGNANTVGGWSTTTIQNQINAAGAGKVSSGANNQEIGAAFTQDGTALNIRGNTSYTAIIFWDRAAAGRGHIAVTTNGTQYNSASDYRLKSNVEELDADEALGTVNRIRPVEYNWRDNPDDAKSTGFIAHELQALFPDAVSGEKDAVDSEGKPVYQGVDYGRITPLLVSAIKALTRRIEQLENKDK